VLGIVLLVLGAGMTATGIVRARGPWAQYQALKAQEDNIARYESWRGGLRDSGPTGASVAMELYRRKTWNAVAVAAFGILCVAAGLIIH